MIFECNKKTAGYLPFQSALYIWYGGGERAPLSNRRRMDAGYAIFAIGRYFIHAQ